MNKAPMRTLRILQMLVHLRPFILISWPGVAYAASQSLGSTLGAISAQDWVALILLSAFSGMVALLHRVKSTLERNARVLESGEINEDELNLVPWWLFGSCHMLGAQLAGFLAFAISEAFDLNTWIEAFSITLISWSGAKAVDVWAAPVVEAVGKRISNALGSKKD